MDEVLVRLGGMSEIGRCRTELLRQEEAAGTLSARLSAMGAALGEVTALYRREDARAAEELAGQARRSVAAVSYGKVGDTAYGRINHILNR